MYCPNCKTQEAMRTSTVDDGFGKLFTFCDKCPRPQEQQPNFPTIIIKRGRGRPRKNVTEVANSQPTAQSQTALDQRLAKIEADNKNFYEANVKMNRELAANIPKMHDSDALRYRDALDKKRATCVLQAVYQNKEQAMNSTNMYLKKKFDPQLGEGNWKIVGQRDALVIAEAIH